MNNFSEVLIKHLPTYDSEKWHQIALNWNWDNGLEPLEWIVSQERCDRGTALLIYWRSGPKYFAKYKTADEVESFERKQYDLTRDIESKLLTGFYKQENICFDPHDDEGTDWTREYAGYPQNVPVPSALEQKTLGQVIEKIYMEEGYPKEVIKEVGESS